MTKRGSPEAELVTVSTYRQTQRKKINAWSTQIIQKGKSVEECAGWCVAQSFMSSRGQDDPWSWSALYLLVDGRLVRVRKEGSGSRQSQQVFIHVDEVCHEIGDTRQSGWTALEEQIAGNLAEIAARAGVDWASSGRSIER
jgi:hypothetical protein